MASITELRKRISLAANSKEQETNLFINTLFSVIENALLTDGLVKVGGLGTFKVLQVEPRKSVNIQTGEDIILQGYKKVVFVPDTNLKNKLAPQASQAIQNVMEDIQAAINEPLLQPAKTESKVATGVLPKTEADPIKKLGEQANEISDLLSDINGIDIPIIETEIEVATDLEPEAQVEEANEQATDTEIHNKKSSVISEPAEKEKSIAENTEVTREPIQQEKKPYYPSGDNASKKSKNTGWKIFGIIMSLICLAMIGGYFFYQNQIEKLVHDKWPGVFQTISGEIQEVSNFLDEQKDEEIEQPKEVREELQKVELPKGTTTVETKKQERKEDVFPILTTVPLKEGSRLTHLARKYYGNRELWVYIFQANTDVITNANDIPVGTRIKIPNLPQNVRDLTIPANAIKVEQMRKNILGE